MVTERLERYGTLSAPEWLVTEVAHLRKQLPSPDEIRNRLVSLAGSSKVLPSEVHAVAASAEVYGEVLSVEVQALRQRLVSVEKRIERELSDALDGTQMELIR